MEHGIEAEAKMSGDVLEKAPADAIAELFDDPLDRREEVALVVFAFALSRLGKRLTWVAREHGVDESAPWSGVEGPHIVPDRGGGEVSGALGGFEGLLGVSVPLNEAGGGKARLGKLKAHVKSTRACCEGEAVSGR